MKTYEGKFLDEVRATNMLKQRFERDKNQKGLLLRDSV
jgi:hypothetical protein